MSYYPKVIGTKCYLSPMRAEDAPVYTKWFNDLEVQRSCVIPVPVITLEAEQEWIANAAQQGDVVFAIVDAAEHRLIGNTGLHRIEPLNRTAELGIVIGEKDCWDKGYGSEATLLMLDYGFNVLNLHSVMLRAYAFNERALACYRKCGFREIGRRREAKVIAGRCWDEIYMDILDSELESPYVKKLF